MKIQERLPKRPSTGFWGFVGKRGRGPTFEEMTLYLEAADPDKLPFLEKRWRQEIDRVPVNKYEEVRCRLMTCVCSTHPRKRDGRPAPFCRDHRGLRKAISRDDCARLAANPRLALVV